MIPMFKLQPVLVLRQRHRTAIVASQAKGLVTMLNGMLMAAATCGPFLLLSSKQESPSGSWIVSPNEPFAQHKSWVTIADSGVDRF